MAIGKSQLNYAIAPLVAMSAPLAAVSGSQILLNTKVAGSTTSSAGLVLGGGNVSLMLVEQDSLIATVQTALTTSALVATTVWQVSDDGTNWVTLYPVNGAAYVPVAPAGTGSAIVTSYIHSAAGLNFPKKYLRLAVVNTGATGGAADIVTVAYSWRQRFTIPG